MTDGVSGIEVKPPITISKDAVTRLNNEGMRYTWEPLRIVDDSRIAMARMPEGKSGVVVGSGPNTQEWKRRGWRTLDIDPSVGADMTIDANQLETVVMPQTLDFVLAECVTFDPKGQEGVSPARLLQQANKSLRMGGQVIIESANFENTPEARVPNREPFSELMAMHGFDTVIEVDIYRHFGEEQKAQRVLYHGKKVSEGFDKNRVVKSNNVSFNPNTGYPV